MTNTNTRNNGNRDLVRNLLISKLNEGRINLEALRVKLGYPGMSRVKVMLKDRAAEYYLTLTYKGAFVAVDQAELN